MDFLDGTIQQFWSYGLEKFHGPLSSPAFPTLLAFATYFFANIPLMAIDLAALDWSQAYKIQPQPMVTWPVMRNAVVMNFWNQILYLIPSTVLHSYLQGVEELPARAPTLLQTLWEVLLCLVVYDTVYFFWHLMHHRVGFLYDVIHSVHHEFHAPFSWIAQHVHPLELIETGCIAIAVPKALGCHPLCTWTWLVVLTLLRIESHCGYSFPFQLSNLVPWGLYSGAEAHDHHHQEPGKNLQPFLTYWDRLFGTYVRPVHKHIGKSLRDESGGEDSPSVVFQMFLLPDMMVRWFDVEYQAHCYALLHSARPNIIHVVSFLAFITSFFAATAALNNLTKNLTLLLASLFLCGTMYRPYCARFRILVIASLLVFWCAGHVAVAILGAYVVQQCYVVVVTASVLINILWQFNSDLFWGCPGAFQTHGIQRSPEARLATVLPHIILRLPWAFMQAFLAPFRMYPAILWLWWFADVEAVERAAVCGRRSGLRSEVTFRHVLKTPFDTTSARLAGLGLPGASLLRTPAVAAATAFLSHSVPTLVQLWFLTDMCLLCRDAVQR